MISLVSLQAALFRLSKKYASFYLNSMIFMLSYQWLLLNDSSKTHFSYFKLIHLTLPDSNFCQPLILIQSLEHFDVIIKQGTWRTIPFHIISISSCPWIGFQGWILLAAEDRADEDVVRGASGRYRTWANKWPWKSNRDHHFSSRGGC
jgi:hypothetical protein